MFVLIQNIVWEQGNNEEVMPDNLPAHILVEFENAPLVEVEDGIMDLILSITEQSAAIWKWSMAEPIDVIISSLPLAILPEKVYTTTYQALIDA